MSNILTQFYVGVGITGGSISLACLLVSALVQRGFGDSLSNDVVRRKAMAGLANSMFEQEHMGDIIVQGQVVDQDGADLEGVNLEAELMLGAYAGRSPTNPVVRQTVGPTFSLTYTNAFSMKLTFRKKGYFEEGLQFSPNHEGVTTWGGKKVVNKQALNVVLSKIGDTTQLVESENRLDIRPSGKAVVAKWDSSTKYSRMILTNINDVLSWPKNGFCVLSGEVPFEVRGTGRSMAMNAGDESHVKLLMFGTNDGFRVFQSTREADMHVFREMREAPDGEYARYVTPTIGHSSLYFFCRVGRKYGKGLAVFSGDMKASNTVVEVSTVIFMQENEGGRNVNAESYRW